jgi:RNA polymerase sigma factor (sigma-70 family)
MGAFERAQADSAGGASGLEIVYLEARPALLRFLRARGAGDAAEDLLQELWIKASAGAAGPIRDPLPYLYRTAANLMLDRRRSELRQARREEDYAGPADERSDEPSPDRRLESRQDLKAAEAALAALGERSVHIFRRFRLEGAGQQQIADELGISLSGVEKHLQRAYRALIEVRRRLDAG